MNGIIVCTAARYTVRRVMRCATCKTRRRMVWHDEVWYGSTLVCCHCGERWQDGERAPRPVRRGWRKESATKATTAWLAAGKYDPAAHHAWVNYQLGYDEEAAA